MSFLQNVDILLLSVNLHFTLFTGMYFIKELPRKSQQPVLPKALNMQEQGCNSAAPITAFLGQSAVDARENKTQLHRMRMLGMCHFLEANARRSEGNQRGTAALTSRQPVYFRKFLQHSGKSMHLVSDTHISSPRVLVKFLKETLTPDTLANGLLYLRCQRSGGTT